ncbi:MAG: type I DNA topoisomerase, partial [candidate division Zixibacteria bacterium]|nr:type I DNA topoisomerase [candidate division Zixibacteria bacterium]
MTAKKKEVKAKKEKGKRTKTPTGELIIVESPTKIRTLKKFLDKKFKVIATKGHILDLPKSKLGVDMESGFAPHYSVIHGKGQVLKDIVKEAKSKVKIYLAPDPDREGEAIAYHLLLKLDNDPGTIKRVTFNEITRTAVLKGLEEATEIDMQKVHAQQARRVLDRLVGYQVSPILWQTMYSGLSAGRVQSVALRIICEREAEITAFVPTEYWSIHSDFSTDDDSRFTAKLFRIDGNEVTISGGDEASGIVDEIKRQQFNVADVRKDEKKRQPLPPYITSTLQQDASRQVGFSTQKTMIVAQQLYEGIELGSEGPVGLITYMRTDSVRTAEEAITAARQSIEFRFGKSYLPDEPRRFRTRKRAQDAHEAIRPTDLENQPSKVKKHLSTEQFKLYSLIYNRFLASQMSQAVYNQIRVDVTGGRFVFRAVDTKL